MLKKLFPKVHSQYSSLPVLGSILEDFAKFLLQLGYSFTTIRDHVCAVRVVDHLLRQQGCDKMKKVSHSFLKACVTRRKGKPRAHISVASAIKLLKQYFDSRGILLSQEPLTPIEEKVAEYKNYLQKVRGLGECTINEYCKIALQFLTKLNKCGGLSYLPRLTLRDIEDFLSYTGRRAGKGYLQQAIYLLRSFLRFLAARGEIPTGMDNQIEAPRIYRMQNLPRTLSWKTVQALLKSIDRSTPIGKRDYSMLLLIATYGLRGCEVVRLKLEDIDWRADTLQIFQRKISTFLTLPLTAAVGKSIIAYLRRGRPEVTFREIFVRHQAPLGILKPTAVHKIFQSRSRRSGLSIPFQGAHCMRHSYAVRLLRQGVPLKTIGDILGHQSFTSTYGYLRLAVEDLRTVPLNLPIGSTSRKEGGQ